MKFTAAVGLDNQLIWPERISGTDCWLSLSARVTRHTNDDTYYTGQLYKAKLELGGLAVGATQPAVTPVYDDFFQLGTPPVPPESQQTRRGPWVLDEYVYPQQYTPRQVRFASNHYQHDNLVRVTLTLTFALYVLDNGTPVRLPASEDVTVTAFADVRVWNRGMRYKPKYSISGQLWNSTHYNYINQLMLAGQSRLADAGYAWPANEPEFQTKSGPTGILADLMQVNGLFINTHGEANGQFGSTADGLHDSFGYQPGSQGRNDPATFMSATDIRQATGATLSPPRSPAVNVAFLYSCAVASWTPIGAEDALNLRRVNGQVRDATLYCFEKTIWPLACTPQQLPTINSSGARPSGFAVHAAKLLDDLKAGYLAQEAFSRAQNAWIVLSVNEVTGLYEDALLQTQGDPRTTLRSVYHPQSEIGSDPNLPGIYRTEDGAYDKWFAIFPKEVPTQ